MKEADGIPQIAHEISQRRYLAISGLLSFLIGSGVLRAAESVIGKPSWHAPIQDTIIAQILFWVLLVYGVIWIVASFVGLSKLSRNSTLESQFADHWWSQQPILILIGVFVEHWIFATLYAFLTADLEQGVILASLSVLHIIIALLIASRISSSVGE